MARGVHSLRDEISARVQYLWIQFADFQIAVGEPCPRGHSTIVRVHPHHGHCATCGASFVFLGSVEPGDGDGAPTAGAIGQIKGRRPLSTKRAPLETLSDVQVFPYERTAELERCYGHGRDAQGERVLVLVDYLLDEEGHRREKAPGVPISSTTVWPAGPFESAIDFDRFGEEDE
jgi:hypothetical protein